jgi:hypothetical protein
MPISNKVEGTEIRRWHDEVEKRLAERHMHHILYNVDGASIERGLTHNLLREARLSGRTIKWTFKHPLSGDMVLDAPMLANGKPRVSTTDGKHAKKNGRNAVTSGACVITMGAQVVTVGDLIEAALHPTSPLKKTDVLGVDKQDDQAMSRVSSAAMIEHVSLTQKAPVSLCAYLYILGELIDAQQNRTMSIEERVRLLFRARFFLEGWKTYIELHPNYTINTHTSSPANITTFS